MCVDIIFLVSLSDWCAKRLYLNAILLALESMEYKAIANILLLLRFHILFFALPTFFHHRAPPARVKLFLSGHSFNLSKALCLNAFLVHSRCRYRTLL